jgi:hypothetical protein
MEMLQQESPYVLGQLYTPLRSTSTVVSDSFGYLGMPMAGGATFDEFSGTDPWGVL